MAAGVPIKTLYQCQLPRSHHFRLKETEISRLNQIRKEELKKNYDQKMKRMGLTTDLSSLQKQSKHEGMSIITKNINANEFFQKHLRYY